MSAHPATPPGRFVPSPRAPFVGGLLLAGLGYLVRLLGVDEDAAWVFHLGTLVEGAGLAVTLAGAIAVGVSLGRRDSAG